jgi:hypothetical protein
MDADQEQLKALISLRVNKSVPTSYRRYPVSATCTDWRFLAEVKRELKQ